VRAIRARLALTLVTLGLVACSPSESSQATADRPPQAVEVVPIERRDIAEILSVVGTIEANESARIQAEVSGIVRAIEFDEGQAVKRGAPLLLIDDRALRAEVAQADANYKFAEATLDRQQRMRAQKAIPELEYDRALAERDVAKAELERLRDRLEKTVVRAPFDGVVGGRDISPGDYIDNATTITTVDDLSQLKMALDVPGRYVASVKPGTKISVHDSVNGRVLASGTVYFVSPTIDAARRSSQVKARLSELSPELRPGMFANVDLVLSERPDALTVPEAAILTSLQGTQIVIAEPDGEGFRAQFVNVTLGLREQGVVEVLSDEPIEGRKVVSAGVGALPLYPDLPLDPRPGTTAYAPLPSG